MASNKFSQISFKSNQVRFSVDDVKSLKTPTHPSNNVSSREIPNMAFINTLIDNKIAASGGGGGGSNYSPDLTKQVDVVHATSSQLYLNGPGEGEAYTKIVLNEALYLEEYQENEVNAISTPLTSGSNPNYNRFVVGTNNFYNPQYLFTTNGNPLIGSGVMNNYGQSYAILEDPTDNNYVFMATDVHPGVYRYNLTTGEQTQLTGANGNGLNGTVRCLAWDWDSYSLICGGDFTATTGGNLPVLKVAKYHNSNGWSSIDGLGGSGISGESVNAICVVNNYGSTKYFFGGSFVGPYDGTSVTNSPNLTCYDTTDGWVSINGGAGIDNGAVLALANDTNNDMLLVGGTFSTIPINGSDTSANCFTRWSYSDNEFNLDVGYFTGTSVNCIYYDDVNTNTFFIGGAFTHAGVGNNNYFDPVQSNCIVQYDRSDEEFHTNDMKICVKARSNDNSTQVVRGISTIYYDQYDTYYLIFGGDFSGYVSLNNLSGDTISKNNFIIIQMNNFNYRLTIHDNNTDEDIFYTTKYYDSATLTWDSVNERWTLLETTRLQNDLSYPETGDYQKLVTVNYVNSAIDNMDRSQLVGRMIANTSNGVMSIDNTSLAPYDNNKSPNVIEIINPGGRSLIVDPLGNPPGDNINEIAIDTSNNLIYAAGFFGNGPYDRFRIYNIETNIWRNLNGYGINWGERVHMTLDSSFILYATSIRSPYIINTYNPYTDTWGNLDSGFNAGYTEWLDAIEYDPSNNCLYVAGNIKNTSNEIMNIAKVDITTGEVSKLATCTGGLGDFANRPIRALHLDVAGGRLFVGGSFTYIESYNGGTTYSRSDCNNIAYIDTNTKEISPISGVENPIHSDKRGFDDNRGSVVQIQYYAPRNEIYIACSTCYYGGYTCQFGRYDQYGNFSIMNRYDIGVRFKIWNSKKDSSDIAFFMTGNRKIYEYNLTDGPSDEGWNPIYWNNIKAPTIWGSGYYTWIDMDNKGNVYVCGYYLTRMGSTTVNSIARITPGNTLEVQGGNSTIGYISGKWSSGLVVKDSSNNYHLVNSAPSIVSTEETPNPVIGTMYFDVNTNKMYVWNGIAWMSSQFA